MLKTLAELVEQIEIGTDQKTDFEDAEAHCANVLRQSDELANKYSSLQNGKETLKGRARRSWKRFKADPDDVRHLRDQLTATVTQLGTIQNNIEIAMAKEISENVDDLHINDKENRKSQIADWFASSNFAEQQTDQLARRHAGTSVWFLENQQYIEWREGGNKTLFCPGIPGSGKSIIVATVVDNLRHHFRHQRDVVVAYFYCNFRRGSEQTLHHMLATLTRQLFQEQASVPKSVEDLYQNHKDRNTRPSNDELKAVLRSLVQDYTKVFLLVDALDECANEDRSRDKLLDELFTLQAQPTCDVNLLSTSRFVPEIINRFQHSLRIEIAALKEDVEKYLSDRMFELCSGVRKHKDLQRDIKTKITAAVDGMFLLARLHFDSLQDKMTPKAVRKALEDLPKGPEALHVAYEEAMIRINQQREGFRQLARKVLTWIVFAREELNISQLQEAVAIEPGIDSIDHENDLIDADEMISVCAGLVAVDSESTVVRLVHYTTQEFFQLTKDKWLPNGETLIAENCIDYLCMEVLESRSIHEYHTTWNPAFYKTYETYHLLRYVGTNWGFHAALLEDTQRYVQAILCDQNKLRVATEHIHGGWSSVDGFVLSSAIRVCMYFDDVKAANCILELGADVNRIDSWGKTLLSWAVRYGGVKVVKLLLSLPKLDITKGEPLCEAVSCNREDLVRLILAQPRIDVNQGAPLSNAARGGHKEIVKLLLARPDVDVNREAPLHRATYEARKEIVKLLLVHPRVDVNLGAPLATAASQRHFKIMKLLLTHPDIDVNAGYPPPLEHGIHQHDRRIVDLLLSCPNINVNQGRSLMQAARSGSTDLVELLLARPEIDVKKDAPLCAAAESRNRHVVELLLAHPQTDVNQEDPNVETPLYYATRFRCQKIVQLLLAQPGIDINKANPLRCAVNTGHKRVLRLLLAHPGVNHNVDLEELHQIVVDKGFEEMAEMIRVEVDRTKQGPKIVIASSD